MDGKLPLDEKSEMICGIIFAFHCHRKEHDSLYVAYLPSILKVLILLSINKERRCFS